MNNFIGSPEWLAERRQGIGASECSIVLGMNPWRSPYQLYLEKTGEETADNTSNQMRWGTLMEPALRQYYANTTGRQVLFQDKLIRHRDFPFIFASLDGFTDDNRVVELKTARSNQGWGDPGTAAVPDYYALQVQQQMLVTGFGVADVVVSIAGGAPLIYEVPADAEIQAIIVNAERDFWRCVTERQEPPLTSYADVQAKFAHSDAQGAVLASDEALQAIQYLKSIAHQKEALAEEEERLKAIVIGALGAQGDTLVSPSNAILCTYKLPKSAQRFDAKRFQAEHAELYTQYLKPAEATRRLLLK